MVTGSTLILIFVLSLAALFFLILKLKWEPYLALIGVAILTGLVVGFPITEIPGVITTGFGNTLTGIGILIGLGCMLGQLLASSGAIEKIAQTLLRLSGAKKSPAAITMTGLVVSIPVFFDAAFVILVGLIKSLSKKTKISMVTFVTALAVGLVVAHAVIPPTPGPLVVSENTGAELGYFILYGIIISIPAVLFGGYFYARWIGKGQSYFSGDINPKNEEIATTTETVNQRPQISAFLSFGLLLLPIVLILFNTMFNLVFPESVISTLFTFIGEKNMALFISVLVAAFLLRPYLVDDKRNLYAEAISSAGLIILITGAGGSFGAIISGSGMGDYLVEVMQGWNMPILLLAFLFSQILRVSLGSTTVALVTTSSILGPMAVGLGASPLLLGLAICAGGIGLSLPNDSGFWVVNKFAGLSIADTIKTWSIGGFIAGVTVLCMVYILSMFQGILPGI